MNDLSEKIKRLPKTMLDAADVEETILLAQQIDREYEQLSLEEKKQCTEIERVKELLNGNSSALDLEHIPCRESILQGKRIGYLGSSITVGMKSENVAFPDYIGKITGSTTLKQAISGGTLAYKQSDAVHDYREKISYIKQLLDQDGILHSGPVDLLLVQLSTNDTTMDISLGQVSGTEKTIGFDYTTVIGAIECIISTASVIWNCPVLFYTNSNIQPEEYCTMDEKTQKHIHDNLVVKYDKMVQALYEVQKKWNIGIIDLWNDPSFREIDCDIKKYYMADIIHPYKSGYYFWYTPKIQNALEQFYADHVKHSS